MALVGPLSYTDFSLAYGLRGGARRYAHVFFGTVLYLYFLDTLYVEPKSVAVAVLLKPQVK